MFTRLIEVDLLREVFLHAEFHQPIRLVVVGTLPNEATVHHLGEPSEEVMVLQDRKVILQEVALDLVPEAVLQAPGMVVVEACLEDVGHLELTIPLDHTAEVHRPVQGSTRLVVCRQDVLHSQYTTQITYPTMLVCNAYRKRHIKTPTKVKRMMQLR